MEKQIRKMIRQFLIQEEILVPAENSVNDEAKKEKETEKKKIEKERLPKKT
jgi:hypothetical protein